MADRTAYARTPQVSSREARSRPPGGRWRRAAVALAVAAVALLSVGVAAPAHADTDDFTFDSFHADMTLVRGADQHAQLLVTETIVARFPEDEEQNRGIIRAIPDDYDGVPLETEVTSVTDEDGDPVPYELSTDDGFLEVATGDDSFVFGAQTYVISYSQRDTIRAIEETASDEFQRDINGTGWDQPFGEVSTTLTMDPELADALTGNAACYIGREWSTEQCDIETSTENGSVVFRASGVDLGAEENLTIAIGFEPGTFVPGEVERNVIEQFAFDATPVVRGASVAAIVLSVVVAIGAIVGRRRGRDAPGRGVIVPQFDPPADVSVMQAAHLIARKGQAVPAALVDLAVSGHVRLLDDESSKGVVLQYVRPSDDAARQDVLVALFGEDAEVGARKKIDAAAQALAGRLGKRSDAARDSLREAGLTEKPDHRVASFAIYAGLGVVVLALVCVLLGVLGRTGWWGGGVAIVAGLLALTLAVSLWRYRDRVTDRGALVRDHLVGLRDYLALAEKDRLRVLQSPQGAERIDTGDPLQVVHLYEELLPYAILWGVEKEWAEVLEVRVREAGVQPTWYDGSSSFSSLQFLTMYGALRSGASASAAAWAGSGGGSYTGGSMGGGFSGMGSGGGGGGGR
ncbi:DUF2207 family protein [Labedella endophytica]|uniref:DUF2207 domain-containing protein n=1 Tax=Labedella endophytica TaxID=1523160 RepID=A0A433JUL2_9MICO|nr:DUF2207 domain-containing protein [Labedella endophytica]RUR01904.1 DUF2207 domain-containing protein [Labedella endophytica]